MGRGITYSRRIYRSHEFAVSCGSKPTNLQLDAGRRTRSSLSARRTCATVILSLALPATEDTTDDGTSDNEDQNGDTELDPVRGAFLG